MVRLAEMAEKLTDVFLEEVDPDTWPSMDTAEGRGDRLWIKKNASKTITVLAQIVFTVSRLDEDKKPEGSELDPGLEKLVQDAERRASEYMKRRGEPTPR